MEITKEILEQAIKEGKIKFMVDDTKGNPIQFVSAEVKIFQEKSVIKIVIN